MSTTRPVNQRAWWFVLPVVISVAFSALIPLMTVVNYSVQDIFGPDQAVFVGMEWYKEVLRDSDLHGALYRQLLFSGSVLAIELPLGIALSVFMYSQFGGVSTFAFSLPWGAIAACVPGILAIVFVTMTVSGAMIRDDNIGETLKEDHG